MRKDKLVELCEKRDIDGIFNYLMRVHKRKGENAFKYQIIDFPYINISILDYVNKHGEKLSNTNYMDLQITAGDYKLFDKKLGNKTVYVLSKNTEVLEILLFWKKRYKKYVD